MKLCWFYFGSYQKCFAPMWIMTIEHWSLMVNVESWFLVLFTTLVVLHRFYFMSLFDSVCVLNLNSAEFVVVYRCGQTLFRNLKMEDLMSLKPMFSGTYMNLLKARFSLLHFFSHIFTTFFLILLAFSISYVNMWKKKFELQIELVV